MNDDSSKRNDSTDGGTTGRMSGTDKGIGEDPPRTRAEHGYRNEVSWDGGKGRQPYANQGDEEKGPPNGWPETENGDRGDASGRTLDQLEEVRKKP